MTQEQLLEGTVIAVDKPWQWTSFQAVNRIKAAIRNTYGIKNFKIGHAGTLDPLATGLLLVCVGKATKRIDELQGGEKRYSGTMVLGATTPCYDRERPIDRYYPYRHLTGDLVGRTASQFVGLIEQVPPIFSAVKINGQRAYSYAREAKEGEAVPSPTPKRVLVREFDITAFHPGVGEPETDGLQEGHPTMPATEAAETTTRQTHLYNQPLCTVPTWLPTADFRICCGKGTYVRSLARDLGAALDSGAFLASLRREQVGEYTLDNAITLDEIAEFLKQ